MSGMGTYEDWSNHTSYWCISYLTCFGATPVFLATASKCVLACHFVPSGKVLHATEGRLCAAHDCRTHDCLGHSTLDTSQMGGVLLLPLSCHRCLAAETWRQHFAADPLSYDAGDHLRRSLLQPGGARAPRDLVRGLLGERALLFDAAGGCMPAPDSYVAEMLTAQRA